MSHWEPEHLAASERLRLGCFLFRSGFFSSQQQLPEAATTASPVQSGSQRLTWTVARSMDQIMNVGTTAKWSALTGPAKWYWRSHDWPICRIRIFKIVSLVSTCSLDIYFWYILFARCLHAGEGWNIWKWAFPPSLPSIKLTRSRWDLRIDWWSSTLKGIVHNFFIFGQISYFE